MSIQAICWKVSQSNKCMEYFKRFQSIMNPSIGQNEYDLCFYGSGVKCAFLVARDLNDSAQLGSEDHVNRKSRFLSNYEPGPLQNNVILNDLRVVRLLVSLLMEKFRKKEFKWEIEVKWKKQNLKNNNLIEPITRANRLLGGKCTRYPGLKKIESKNFILSNIFFCPGLNSSKMEGI